MNNLKCECGSDKKEEEEFCMSCTRAIRREMNYSIPSIENDAARACPHCGGLSSWDSDPGCINERCRQAATWGQ